MAAEGYVCRRCGRVHAGPPFAYHVAAPDYWTAADAARGDSFLGGELCTIRGEHHFIHGRIVLTVRDAARDFEWGVWVSLSAANFRRVAECWEREGREGDPPAFGWLATTLPGYPATLNLKTLVHTQPVGERPTIELEPTDHPLAVEQREGITLARVREIAELVEHGDN